MSGTYKFKGRARHSAPVIGDSLYLWGGGQLDLPGVHDSPQKRKVTSTVEIFSFSSARWSSHLTRGTPPLGVMGYSCTTLRSNIYYYAGYCGHDRCYYNSLTVLNTLTMSWTQLHPNDESMMKKGSGRMLSLELDGTDYLFMVGGIGTTPVKHPQFQYEQIKDDLIFTNEQLLYNLFSEQFTVPSVSGQCCPPTDGFKVNKINQNKGIMFGGIATRDIPTNNVFIFTVTHNTIHWESIKKGSISGEGLWLKDRCYHASAILNGDSTSPTLVVIGGMDNKNQLVNDCFLFDNITTGQFSCKKIPLPDSVTGRFFHSLTAVTMSPNCVWLVIVGGCEGFHQKEQKYSQITDTNRLIIIIGLIHEGGEWIVQSVLDGNDLTSKKYQEKYSSYSKTRTWWMDQLIGYPTEKEMKLQRYIHSLHQELQVAHQNKVSLQEALTEANKQGSNFDGSQLVIMNEKLEEVLQEKQIITEDIEKLRATVAYNEVYITEIEEEKKQVEEEKRKAEDENKQAKKEKEQAEEEKRRLEEQYLIDKQITKELKAKVAVNDIYITELEEENEKVEKQYRKERQTTKELKSQVTELEEEKKQVEEEKREVKEQYLVEKQITDELKAKVADNELYTAKLMKEKEQWSQTKETSTKEVQFDYMIPSMDNLECLSDVQIAEKKLFLIQGDKPQLMNWEEYGVRIGVQEGSLLSSETVEAAVVALVGGQFEFPPNTVLVSAVYAVSLSKPLLKRLKLEIQHCVDLTGQPDLAQYLKFAIAPVSTPSLPYQFSIVEGGEFSSDTSYGSISRAEFCLVGVCGECSGADESGGGGGGTTDNLPSGSTSSADPISVNSSCTSNVPQQLGSNSASVSSQSIKYAGLVYYEEKGVEDLVTFTAAKKLNALLKFIKKDCPQAKRDLNVYFRIASPDGFVELNLNAPQKKSYEGWTIEPRMTPCRLYQDDINNFGDKDYPLPPSCPISVYGSPDAVPTLNYSVPLEGVARPVTLYIHRSQRTAHPIAAAPSASGGDEANPVPTKRRRERGFDIKTAKQKIKQVMIENHTDFARLLQFSLVHVANKLFEVHMIPPEVQQSPTYDAISSCFLSMMSLFDSKSDLEKHCMVYLEALSSVGGPIEFAANLLREKWTAALEGALQFEQSVKRVRTDFCT